MSVVRGPARWLLAAPLCAAVVFSWVRLVVEPFDVPRDDDYLEASRILRAEGFRHSARGGDALVILPPWSLRPLKVLGDLEPISGDDIADRPLHRWARLWALVEADADDERDALVARRGPPSWSRDVGRVRLERWDLPPPSVSDDLAARLADANVRVVGATATATAAATATATATEAPERVGDASEASEASDAPGITTCTPTGASGGLGAGAGAGAAAGGGFRCGDEHWQRVRREWLHVSENADLAVFAHPPSDNARLELTWSDVTIGQSVVVTAGFTRDGADNAKAPVRVRVLVDGNLAGTLVRQPAFLFATEVVDTSKWAGTTGAVTLAIDSENNAGAHFAFDAYVVRAAAP